MPVPAEPPTEPPAEPSQPSRVPRPSAARPPAQAGPPAADPVPAPVGCPPELDLTAPEADLWESYRHGRHLDLRVGVPEEDDPTSAEPWGPERTIRAHVLATLLLSPPPAALGRTGSLMLSGAYVSGRLDLAGASVSSYVEMNDCRLEELLHLSEAKLATWRMVHCALPRLHASRLSTTGDLHLPQCIVSGGVRITDARIGTDLLLNQLEVGPDQRGFALLADGLTVDQDVDAEELTAFGEVSLRSARIGGSLSLRRSFLTAPDSRHFALNGPRMTIEHTLYLSDGFVAEGPFRLDDARFGNALLIDDALFKLGDEQELSMRRMQTPELRYMPGQPPTGGSLRLSRAQVGNLVDAPEGWPKRLGGLGLTGFTYESLRPVRHFSLDQRKAWLAAATPSYRPEPYEQLARALRAAGQDHDAREVLLAKQRRRRDVIPLVPKLWGYVQDAAVAYGYRPGRAAVWIAVLWALGSVYFASVPHHAMKPDEAPHWNPALYTLDLLLPVVDLGQSAAWRTSGPTQWVAVVLILLGWTLATTVAAGVTRVLSRV